MKRYKKRTYKKRPYAKRRSSTRRTYRRAMRPDGGYKEKITKVIPIYSDPNDLNAGILDDEHQYFNINWYDDGAAATDRYTNYNSGQHQQQVLNFLYYKPYLMTYKYTPRNVAPTGGNDTALIQSIQVASFRPTTQAASTEAEEKEQLQQKMDFKLYTANGGHRRSYKTGRFLAKQKLRQRIEDEHRDHVHRTRTQRT